MIRIDTDTFLEFVSKWRLTRSQIAESCMVSPRAVRAWLGGYRKISPLQFWKLQFDFEKISVNDLDIAIYLDHYTNEIIDYDVSIEDIDVYDILNQETIDKIENIVYDDKQD